MYVYLHMPICVPDLKVLYRYTYDTKSANIYLMVIIFLDLYSYIHLKQTHEGKNKSLLFAHCKKVLKNVKFLHVLYGYANNGLNKYYLISFHFQVHVYIHNTDIYVFTSLHICCILLALNIHFLAYKICTSSVMIPACGNDGIK